MDDQFYKSYTTEVRNTRGEIIEFSTILERFIDFYLAKYFCSDPDKRIDLLELIIATKRMIFENKVQVFKILIERHEKVFYEENKGIIGRIIKLLEHRNVFAHYTLSAGKEALERFKDGSITFIKFNGDTEDLVYTKTQIEDIKSQFVNYASLIKGLIDDGHGFSH